MARCWPATKVTKDFDQLVRIVWDEWGWLRGPNGGDDVAGVQAGDAYIGHLVVGVGDPAGDRVAHGKRAQVAFGRVDERGVRAVRHPEPSDGRRLAETI